jgi:hypothetical protein
VSNVSLHYKIINTIVMVCFGRFLPGLGSIPEIQGIFSVVTTRQFSFFVLFQMSLLIGTLKEPFMKPF